MGPDPAGAAAVTLGHGRSVDIGAILAIAAVGLVLVRLGIGGRARTYATASLLAAATFLVVLIAMTPQLWAAPA